MRFSLLERGGACVLVWLRPWDGGFCMGRPTLVVCLAAVCGFVATGCRSMPDDAPPPSAKADSLTLQGTLEDVWQGTRQALLDQDYEIYTRDKRGLFVAYTKVKRRFFVFPHRTQLTVTIEAVSGDETRLSVETIHQKYRVSLLTYPDWRDDPDPAEGDEGGVLLEAIRGTIGGDGGASKPELAEDAE